MTTEVSRPLCATCREEETAPFSPLCRGCQDAELQEGEQPVRTQARFVTIRGTGTNVLTRSVKYDNKGNRTPNAAVTNNGKYRCQANARGHWDSQQCSRSGSYLEPYHETYSSGRWEPQVSVRWGYVSKPQRNGRGEVVGYERDYGIVTREHYIAPEVLFHYCKQHSMEGHNAELDRKDEDWRRQREAANESYARKQRRQEAIMNMITRLGELDDLGELDADLMTALYQYKQNGGSPQLPAPR